MDTIGILKNTIQEYAWGSFSAIAELLDLQKPAQVPQAELWMGAHPKAPSMVEYNGRWRSLLDLIAQRPEEMLGRATARKFERQLPYLFKVLAAAKPLSIQAHPNRAQARQGFDRENLLRIPLNAALRNYKDDNHKPECICALTNFWGLKGFRPISEILALMAEASIPSLAPELEALRRQPDPLGLKHFFNRLMTIMPQQQQRVIQEAAATAQKLAPDDPVFAWILTLQREYPSDIGVLAPLMMNLVCLRPGQALFLPAGELHAYLDGVGVELMANSDNVLRGGLTPKHVDVPELLAILDFEPRPLEFVSTSVVGPGEERYASPAEEFVLSVIRPPSASTYLSPPNRSIEILLCTEGQVTLTDVAKQTSFLLPKGVSAVIPAAVKAYTIVGQGTLYKAAVPT